MTTAPRFRAGRAVLAVVALLALALFTGSGTAGAESAVCTPTGVEDSYSTTQDTPLDVTDPELGVLGNDTTCFVGDAVVSSTTSHGSLSLAADGTFTYTPVAGFSGSDSFVYAYVVEIPARQGVSEQVYTATATIYVNCVDRIADDEYSVPQDTALVVPGPGVTTNDHLCPGRGVQVVDQPTHGTLNAFDQEGGGFTYTPSAGFVGVDTYTYRITFLDDRGRPTAVQILATVTINVTPVVIVTQPPTTTSTTTTTTTTTVPETTTTIEETTTTEAPTTTTTTAPAAVSGGSTALPRTGSDPGPAVTVGLILVTLGAITLVVRRRRLA